MWPKVSRSLPKTFKLKNGQRHDEGAVHDALREALAYTLIHADYFGIGGVVIKKYTDCFLFSNPGCLLISQAQYYKGGISVPRNNSIQTMFLLLGYGEKAGSGSTRIMNAWEGAHWRKPLINVLPRPDRVELCLSMEQLLPQKSINKLISVFGEEITHLYGDGLIALTTAEMEGCVSNVRLQQLINKHSTEISQLLKDLCNEGYLVAENKGRWTVYHWNLREEKKTVQKNLFEETMTPPVRNDDTSGKEMDEE